MLCSSRLSYPPFSTEELTLIHSVKKKKTIINKNKTHFKYGVGGLPCPHLDIKLWVTNEVRGGEGAITVSAEGLPSLPHPGAAACPPHLLAAAHSGRLSP